MGAVSWGKYIFVCGGISGNSATEDTDYVEKYSTETDSWSLVSPMKYKRSDFAMVALGKYLYAIGGTSNGSPVEKVSYRIIYSIYSFKLMQKL